MVQALTNDDGQEKIPQELYSAITSLITCNTEDLWHLCRGLEAIIRNKTGEISINSGDPPLYLYTVKRLLRGLASTSDVTRSNFASALLYVLLALGPLSFSKILALMDTQLSLSALASLKRSERTALLKGRLVALDILLELPKNDAATLTVHLDSIYQEVVHLFLKHRGIERPAFRIISRLHSQLPFAAADRMDKSSELSSRHRALMLLHDIAEVEEERAIWKHALREPSAGDSSQSLYVYSLAFLQYLMRTSSPRAFVSAWRIICRMVAKSEKKWFPFMRGLLIDLSSSDLMNDRFVTALLKSSSFTRILARKNTDLIFILNSVCKSSRCIRLLVKGLAPLKDIPLVCGALGSLSESKFKRVLNQMFPLDDKKSPPQYLFDLISSLTKVSGTRDDFLQLCIRHMLERSIEFILEDKVRERVHGIILGVIKINDDPTWLGLEPRINQLLMIVQDSILTRDALDEPLMGSFKQGLQLLKDMQMNAAEPQRILSNFCKIALILVAIDPTASVTLTDELYDCAHAMELEYPSRSESEIKSPYDVLVDILISWLARRSALLRLFSDALFKQVAPHLTSTAVDNIAAVLTAKPGRDNDHLEEDDSNEENLDDDQGTMDGVGLDFSVSDDATDSSSPDDDPVLSDHKNMEMPESSKPKEDSDTESVVIDLGTAGEHELQLLDQQLGAIMAARKKAKTDVKSDVFQFKQRLADWIMILLDGGASDAMSLLSILVEAVVSHCTRISEKSCSSTLEAELLSKLYQILRSVNKAIAKMPMATDEADRKKVAHHLKTIVASLTSVKLSTKDISKILPSIRLILPRADMADANLALATAWQKLTSDLKSRHSSSLLLLWQTVRTAVPDLVLLQLTKDFSDGGASKLRAKELTLLVELALASLKEASREIRLRFIREAQQFFMVQLSKAPDLLSYLKHNLPLLYKIMNKSRMVLQERACEFWSSTCESIELYLEKLANAKNIQGNQLVSLHNQLRSARAALAK